MAGQQRQALSELGLGKMALRVRREGLAARWGHESEGWHQVAGVRP